VEPDGCRAGEGAAGLGGANSLLYELVFVLHS